MDTRGIGCGIWPILLKDKEFQNCCAWHDLAYTEGSWHEHNMTRAEVDKRFLGYMLDNAEGFFSKARAIFYYSVSRALGRLFWEGKVRSE